MVKAAPWIGTSWKMNKLRVDAVKFSNTLKTSAVAQSLAVQPFVIPPFPYIAEVSDMLRGTRVKIGAQNMHWADAGAWTGEISAAMLQDIGATMVEIGHSERRTFFGETDDTVALKVEAALRHDLLALVCIGDTRAEYDQGQTATALEKQVRALLRPVAPTQLHNVIIAYEPVWSIGEGGTPATPEFANGQHRLIADLVKSITGGSVKILYGGSVNPENCDALIAQTHIDGLFIGRSAWDAQGYINIIQSVLKSQGVPI